MVSKLYTTPPKCISIFLSKQLPKKEYAKKTTGKLEKPQIVLKTKFNKKDPGNKIA